MAAIIEIVLFLFFVKKRKVHTTFVQKETRISVLEINGFLFSRMFSKRTLILELSKLFNSTAISGDIHYLLFNISIYFYIFIHGI